LRLLDRINRISSQSFACQSGKILLILLILSKAGPVPLLHFENSLLIHTP